tara:strand:+ start:11407 stop:11898 length:492 start_codon:yes stop_codon:yes gene_type:complete
MEAKIIIEDNIVRKQLGNHKWPKPIYDMYMMFCHDKPYCMKELHWENDKEYTMEKLDIICTVQEALEKPHHFPLNKKVLLDIMITYNQIYLDCLKFSKDNLKQMYFMHRDMGMQNLVVTYDLEVKLIDVDAFEITPSLVPWKFLNTNATVQWLVNEKLPHVPV